MHGALIRLSGATGLASSRCSWNRPARFPSRVSLWLLQMGIFDKSYATDVAGGAGDHAYPDPDLFEVETPCGHYQGVTDRVVMSRKLHGAPQGSFSVAAPMVRIHLPPAVSQQTFGSSQDSAR
jgi:hypothetical protein